MKKYLVVFVAVGTFLLGGVTTYALSNYYGDLLTGQQNQMQDDVKKVYDERKQHQSEVIHHELVEHVESKRQEILKEMESYIDNKVSK